MRASPSRSSVLWRTLSLGVVCGLVGCLSDPTLLDCSHFPDDPACQSRALDAQLGPDVPDLGLTDAERPSVDMIVDGASECIPGETQTCELDIDACGGAHRVCSEGGTWGECEPLMRPSDEECNGLDDDCDGEIDEHVSRVCGSALGACEQGRSLCVEGEWGACDSPVMPGDLSERCNGVDDDCDGTMDESIPFFNAETAQVTSNGLDHSPAIAAGPDSFGIAYARQISRTAQAVFMERRDLMGERVGQAIRVDGNAGAIIGIEVTAMAIAPWAGQGEGGFVVAWAELWQGETNGRLYLSYIGPDGQQIGRALPIVRATGSFEVRRITRITAAGSGGDGIAIAFDVSDSASVYYVYRPGIGPFQHLTEMVSSDAWGSTIISLGGQRFLVGYGTYRSRVCRPGPCTPENSPTGIYFVEYDGTQSLRTERVYFGDPDDMPHLEQTPDSILMFWEALLLGDYIIEFGHFDPQSWAATHNAPTRLDRGQGTARRPVSGVATDQTGQPTRLAVLWTDERTGDPRVYYRPMVYENGAWEAFAVDRTLFSGRAGVSSPDVVTIGDTFGLVARDTRGTIDDSPDEMGIIFAAGPLSCPKPDEGN